jgi:hypothetical protein
MERQKSHILRRFFGGIERTLSTLLEGRGVPEKVTNSASFSAVFGPMPETRCRPSRDPNAPSESLSATMRDAMAGEMCGRSAISVSGAVSRSTIRLMYRGSFVTESARGLLPRFFFGLLSCAESERTRFRFAPFSARAFQTASRCASSAVTAAGAGLVAVCARYSRVPAPRTRTPPRKSKARCSDERDISETVSLSHAATTSFYCLQERIISADSTARARATPPPRPRSAVIAKRSCPLYRLGGGDRDSRDR